MLHNPGRGSEYESKSMPERTRRRHAGTFKTDVAVGALCGDLTLTELAGQSQVHPAPETE